MTYRELSCYPVANSSARGLSRVYFCAHEDDFSLYFREICDEILNICNCAIWHESTDGNEINREDYWFNLRQMNLFVIPVTEKLLTDTPPLAVAAYRMALTCHIPVLPIVLESGLEERYATFFGNLQYLNPNETDATALPYREKLSAFLDSVLLHDKLITKIRSHFDTCIFMSYRKKDRVCAQKLMHLIHENRFCRDVAIWYDEFLTLGEDFNITIQNALKSCSIFALTVTPHLLEDGNYVMTHEYKMAIKENKPVFVAEMLPTDRNELQEKYENIPTPIDPCDSEALSARLAELLAPYIREDNDSDPEHTYYIGLAYLNGIDVETDHERALVLIESAADANFPDALKRLADMYRNGFGVERDIEKGLVYQKRYSEFLRNKYQEEKSYEAARAYLSSLTGLTTYVLYVPVEKKQELLEAEYNGSALLMEDYPQNHLFIAAHIHASVSLGCDVYAASGDLEQADVFCRYAITQYAERIGASPEIDRLFRGAILTDCYTKYAKVLTRRGKLAEAANYLYKAICIYEEKTVGERFADNVILLLVQNYMSLAELYAKDKSITRMTDPLLSLETLCLSVKEGGTELSKRKRLFINCANTLANAYYHMANEDEKAERFFKECCDMADALFESEKSAFSAEFVLMEHWSYGHFLTTQKRYEEAVVQCSLALSKTVLFEKPPSAVKMAIISCYCEWGNSLCELSKYTEASEIAEFAFKFIDTYNDTLTDSESESLRVSAYKLLYKINLACNDTVGIEECFAFLRPHIEKELPNDEEGTKKRLQHKYLHAKLCIKRANAHLKDGQNEDAYAYYLKAMTLITEINKEFGTSVERLSPAVDAMHGLARAALRLKDIRTAITGFVNAVTLLETLKEHAADSASENERADTLRRLANICSETAEFCHALESKEYTTKYCRKLVQYAVELFGLTGSSDDQYGLVRAHIAAAKMDPEKRSAYLTLASAMLNDLCKKHPENEEYAALREMFPH